MELIRLGAFELRPSERTLIAGGKAVELGARAFDLLLVLVEQPGRLVSKATLLERVWPRLVVDENNLPTQVAALRRILGAGAIRTVPGFGYRLELPVTQVDPAAPVAPAAGAPLTALPHQSPRLQVPRRTLPERLGPLIGRDRERAELEALLGRSWLVTLVGAAGVGKSRIAQEFLTHGLNGAPAAVAWIPLQTLIDVQQLPSAIAVALGLTLAPGVEVYTALSQSLEQAPVLLILDGAEHLGEALATPLAGLVAQTPGVRALVTSQAPLGIPWESVYRLQALPVPDVTTPQSEAEGYAAVELFARRAAAADQRFAITTANLAAIAEICRRLDGNPLALELAAARVPALGVAALLERLNDRFRLLKLAGRAADPRHGTLHAAFDWSYGLLSAAEQRVFDRLGVFVGSFTLEAAAHCVADIELPAAEAVDLIGRLVDRSLVSALPQEPPRYALLETARYYALDRLGGGQELDAARRRMAAAMLALLDAAYEEYWSLDEAQWRHRYEPEIDNVRAAMDWALGHDRALGVALYGSAWPLFVELDLQAEGRERYELILTLLSDALPRARVARFWEAIATYDSTRQCDRARYAAELAVSMHAPPGDARARYYALMQLVAAAAGDPAAAATACTQARALERSDWPPRLLAHGALAEGALLIHSGAHAEARATYRRAMKHALAISQRQALCAAVNVVELDIACDETAAALQLGRPLVSSLRHSGRRETRLDLLGLVFTALLLAGELEEARAVGVELHELASRVDVSRLHAVLDALAYLACLGQRYPAAARIALCADRCHAARGQPQRQPVAERMRSAVAAVLDDRIGQSWRSAAADDREPLDEAAAGALALGLQE